MIKWNTMRQTKAMQRKMNQTVIFIVELSKQNIMVSRKELLKNIQSYSPEEIADAIRAGIVTLYELGHDTEGQFTPLLKNK